MKSLPVEICHTNSMKRDELFLHAVEKEDLQDGPVRYEIAEVGEKIVLRKIYMGNDENPYVGFFVSAINFADLIDSIEEKENIELHKMPFRP